MGSITDALTTTAPVSVATIPKPVPVAPTPATPQHKWYDIVTGTVNSISNLANSASNAVTAVKGSGGSTPGYDSNIPSQPPAPVKSNTGKYLIAGGIVLALGIVAVVVVKKVKKKK